MSTFVPFNREQAFPLPPDLKSFQWHLKAERRHLAQSPRHRDRIEGTAHD
jgi:hypothetical protein